MARAALDALSAHVAILDGCGRIVATNRAWREFAVCNGLSLDQACEGQNYLQICSRSSGGADETATRMAAAIREVLDGTREAFEMEYPCHSPAEERWFLCRVVRVPGCVPRAVVSHENITQVKLRERNHLRAQRLESLGTLAGGVAHDLNNTLGPVLMGLELLREEFPGENELLDTLETSARRGADLVRQLMMYAKGADGEYVALDVGALLREARVFIRATFPESIRVEFLVAPGLPRVRGDATQLHQVVLNLAINARDAMPDGGALTVEARGVELAEQPCAALPAGRYVVVSVTDTGSGIDPDILERVFDPFFTTKAAGLGTGLGLSTALGIVKGHGGRLAVETRVGRGSTFTVCLPALPETP